MVLIYLMFYCTKHLLGGQLTHQCSIYTWLDKRMVWMKILTKSKYILTTTYSRKAMVSGTYAYVQLRPLMSMDKIHMKQASWSKLTQT